MIESFKVNQLTVEIHQDSDPMDPREWDNVGKMVCWHRNYLLGDEQPKCSPSEYLFQLMCDREFDKYRKFLPDEEVVGEENIRKYVEKHFHVLPLYLYDHSGITMSTSRFSCPWDSGQVGFIYAPMECDEYPDMEKGLVGEVETYDKYMRGDFCGYRIKDEHGNELDSCWDFDDFSACKERGRIEAEFLSRGLCVAAGI
jgi:hypothetical protein